MRNSSKRDNHNGIYLRYTNMVVLIQFHSSSPSFRRESTVTSPPEPLLWSIDETAHQMGGLSTRTTRRLIDRGCPESPWGFCRKDGERLTTLRRSFKSAIKKAGIENFWIHDQRHTVASWLIMDGVPRYTVRNVLRHSSIKRTERYAHLSPENTRAALSLLDKSRNSHADGRERPSKFS
jgi:hypothetical protein